MGNKNSGKRPKYYGIGEVNPYGIKFLVKLMKVNGIKLEDIKEDNMLAITEPLAKYLERDLEVKKLNTTLEIREALKYIEENHLLD